MPITNTALKNISSGSIGSIWGNSTNTLFSVTFMASYILRTADFRKAIFLSSLLMTFSQSHWST